MNSGAGFLGYISHVQVSYAGVTTVSAAAVAGSFLGTYLATRIEPFALRHAFAGFVMVMACFILVREGSLVPRTLASAVPTSWPQLVLATLMLGLGVLAGRGSKPAADATSQPCILGRQCNLTVPLSLEAL